MTDVIFRTLEWFGSSDYAIWLLLGPALAHMGWRLWIGVRRRREYRAFAQERGFIFVAATFTKRKAPFDRFERVEWQGFAWNLMAGTWEGLTLHLFDLPRGRYQSWTTAIVESKGELRHGPAATAVAAAEPNVHVETRYELLCVSLRRQLEAAELPTFLSFAVALARAMERDAKTTPGRA